MPLNLSVRKEPALNCIAWFVVAFRVTRTANLHARRSGCRHVHAGEGVSVLMLQSTHPNADRIRAGFDAFMHGDAESARSLFTKDVVWHVSGNGPLSGDCHGFDAITAWGGRLAELSHGTFREELVSVVADDNWAVQVATCNASRNSQVIEDSSVNVFRMVEGEVAECWVLFGDVKSFDRFWK